MHSCAKIFIVLKALVVAEGEIVFCGFFPALFKGAYFALCASGSLFREKNRKIISLESRQQPNRGLWLTGSAHPSLNQDVYTSNGIRSYSVEGANTVVRG